MDDGTQQHFTSINVAADPFHTHYRSGVHLTHHLNDGYEELMSLGHHMPHMPTAHFQPHNAPSSTLEEPSAAAFSYPPRTSRKSVKMTPVFKKAPGAPKRFKSSYVHFFTDFVERKKQQICPDGLPVKFDIGEVSKECSLVWKNLSPHEKHYWESVSEKEKEEYNRTKQSYDGPWHVATDKVRKEKSGAPKRSPSAFFLFVNSKRDDFKMEYPNMTHSQVIKMLSEVWHKLPEHEKMPFREEELKQREQYKIDAENWRRAVKMKEQEDKQIGKKEKSEYMASMKSTDVYLPLQTASHGAAKKRKKDPSAPKRSPPAFFLFVNYRRPQIKDKYPQMAHTEIIQMLGSIWEKMNEEEKKPFRDHEEQLRKQYHIEVQNYKSRSVSEKVSI